MRLKRKFFKRSADAVARELLGKVLVRKFPDGSTKKGVIIETEAYMGVEDKAAHSYGGRRTKRTEVMFGKSGVAYVYFTYGVHWMLNIITSKVGDPQGVLIRGVREIGGVGEVRGPGKVTKFFKIDGSFYGEDVVEGERFWVEDRGSLGRRGSKGEEIIATARVGINYAGDWKDKQLRFLLKEKK